MCRFLLSLLFVFICSPAFSQSHEYDEYFIRCTKDGKVDYWTSMPIQDEHYCGDLLDDFCRQTYVNGEQISNRQQEEMAHFFYHDGEIITADKVNDLCNYNKKVLK